MLFRGKKYTAAKRWFGSTPRYAETAEVLSILEKDLRQIGVTRRGFLTGYAGLGVPCAAAYRPQGINPGPALGKGLSRDQAMASAGMEAIERAAGEIYSGPLLRASYRELSQSYPMIRIDQLLLSKQSFFHQDLEIEWGLGWDIVNQEEVPVPVDLIVFGAYRRPGSLGAFESSTNGLAAGVVLAEAACQALLELIERDGLKLHKYLSLKNGSRFPLRRIRLADIDDTMLQSVIERIRQHDANVALFDCTVDTEVPIYTACIFDQTRRPPMIAQGFGASLNPRVAMLRATTEAVLGAAENNLGTRMTRGSDWQTMKTCQDFSTYFSALEDAPEMASPRAWSDCSTDSFHGDLNICLHRLQSVGVERVLLFDMTLPGMQTCVVRALTPGLEGLYEFSFCRFGKRSKQYANGQQQ
ncbi:YcaO-like family protein [Desulfovibrio inopinatus]|uniref:YcaO-like family protein n=1 Tax=Desulfovibrio inopinatus TaxID=102109 RepID=UPI0004226DFA|nr:YcaO-like family protein [Desulfovibrio inopinatus]